MKEVISLAESIRLFQDWCSTNPHVLNTSRDLIKSI